MPGAHAVGRYLRRFGPEGARARLAGLCDAGAEDIVRRGLAAAGVGSPRSRADLERLPWVRTASVKVGCE